MRERGRPPPLPQAAPRASSVPGRSSFRADAPPRAHRPRLARSSCRCRWGRARRNSRVFRGESPHGQTFAERHNSALCCRICGGSCATNQCVFRRDIDDGSTCLLQPGERPLAHAERAHQIHVDDPTPEIRSRIFERAQPVPARIVDHHVEPRAELCEVAKCVPHGAVVGHVEYQGRDLQSIGLELCAQGTPLLWISASRDDLIARFPRTRQTAAPIPPVAR